MLTISWTERKNDDEVLKRQEFSVPQEKNPSVYQRQLAFLEHALRKHGLKNLVVIEKREQHGVRD